MNWKRNVAGILTVAMMLSMPFNKVVKAEKIDDIEEKIEKMTIEEKVGQILMIKVDSWNNEIASGKTEGYEKIVKDYNIGGVILFGANFSDGSKGAAELVNGLQKSANEPLLVAIDQEGGGVTRIADGTSMPGNMAMGATNDTELARDVYKAIGEEVKAVGANLNLGPVCDISSNELNTIISLRSFGGDKNLVSKMVKANVQGSHDANIMVAAKHFPGQGATEGDTHTGTTIVNQDLETIKKETIIPFTEGIYSDVDFIMPTHSVFPALDNGKIIATEGSLKGEEIPIPATYSKKILTDLLRNKIGFDGVVITDALDMGAVSEHFTPVDSAIYAINAGCDMLLMPPVWLYGDEDVPGFHKYFTGIVDAVKSGAIKEDRLDEAVRRILTKKVQYNLYNDKNISLENHLNNVDKYVGSEEHNRIEELAADKSVTLVKNENKMLPFTLQDNSEILVIDYKITTKAMGYTSEWTVNYDNISESITKLANDNELSNVNVKYGAININYEYDENWNLNLDYSKDLDGLYKDIDDADYVIIAPYMAVVGLPWYQGIPQLPEVNTYPQKLIEYANKTNKNYVALNVREPYGVSYMDDSKAILSIYANLGGDMATGMDPSIRLANVDSGIKTIFGYNNPTGTLPINLENYKIGHGLKYD